MFPCNSNFILSIHDLRNAYACIHCVDANAVATSNLNQFFIVIERILCTKFTPKNYTFRKEAQNKQTFAGRCWACGQHKRLPVNGVLCRAPALGLPGNTKESSAFQKDGLYAEPKKMSGNKKENMSEMQSRISKTKLIPTKDSERVHPIIMHFLQLNRCFSST